VSGGLTEIEGQKFNTTMPQTAVVDRYYPVTVTTRLAIDLICSFSLGGTAASPSAVAEAGDPPEHV
jgi:hypothetical protein